MQQPALHLRSGRQQALHPRPAGKVLRQQRNHDLRPLWPGKRLRVRKNARFSEMPRISLCRCAGPRAVLRWGATNTFRRGERSLVRLFLQCHPDICQPTPLAPGQPCTTEYRIGSECYRNRTLTTCGRFGPNNQCAFTKTPDLDKCLRDARARFESRVVGDATEKDQSGAGDDASKKTDDKTPPSMDALVQMLQQLIQIMQQGGSK